VGGGAAGPARRYAHTVSSPDRARRRPGSPSHRDRRDRHGRGLRGRLVPANVPLFRTKSEIFDDLVLDAIEGLERTYSRELAGVEFAVEDVPPDLNVYDSDVLEDGEVPLARLLPGAPGRPNTPARIVLYRRPLEFRAIDNEDLADLVHDVIIEQVANLLGIDPEELDSVSEAPGPTVGAPCAGVARRNGARVARRSGARVVWRTRRDVGATAG
jgi:predicted Zn-dependent protease with MMP-like domain